MSNQSLQHNRHGESPERSRNARQAAEALFAPKPQRAGSTILGTASASEAIRKPRVLTVAVAASIPHAEPAAPPITESPRDPVIPITHFARIRAWMKYGMTAVQVGELYGVAAGEVERIFRSA